MRHHREVAINKRRQLLRGKTILRRPRPGGSPSGNYCQKQPACLFVSSNWLHQVARWSVWV